MDNTLNNLLSSPNRLTLQVMKQWKSIILSNFTGDYIGLRIKSAGFFSTNDAIKIDMNFGILYSDENVDLAKQVVRQMVKSWDTYKSSNSDSVISKSIKKIKEKDGTILVISIYKNALPSFATEMIYQAVLKVPILFEVFSPDSNKIPTILFGGNTSYPIISKLVERRQKIGASPDTLINDGGNVVSQKRTGVIYIPTRVDNQLSGHETAIGLCIMTAFPGLFTA